MRSTTWVLAGVSGLALAIGAGAGAETYSLLESTITDAATAETESLTGDFDASLLEPEVSVEPQALTILIDDSGIDGDPENVLIGVRETEDVFITRQPRGRQADSCSRIQDGDSRRSQIVGVWRQVDQAGPVRSESQTPARIVCRADGQEFAGQWIPQADIIQHCR